MKDIPKIKNVLFSRGTYQIEVVDGDETHWPFLQINNQGEIKDAFCDCGGDISTKCEHLKLAIDYILDKDQIPIHVKFKKYFFLHLNRAMADSYGFGKVKTLEDYYAVLDSDGIEVFIIKPKSNEAKKILNDLLHNRKPETEETSIKFSLASEEELQRWREGNPSFEMSFELSFWSDLAKWWYISQKNGIPCEIRFVQENQSLPHKIILESSNFEASFFIRKKEWASIIPSLNTIKSKLKVYRFEKEFIDHIEYDKNERTFLIKFKNLERKHVLDGFLKSEEAEHVNGWVFVPGDGFYEADFDPLLDSDIIPKSEVDRLFKEYPGLLIEKLENEPIYPEPISINYSLFFDDNQNLHISCFIFEKGDLHHENIISFPWIYIEKKGFFKLNNLIFNDIEHVVLQDDVSDFVVRHREWLQKQPGFAIHVAGMESYFIYFVKPDGKVRFESRSVLRGEQLTEVEDFGGFSYVKGQGFYPKTVASSAVISHGLEITKSEMSEFIRSNYEELENVRGFFAPSCPVEKLGLAIYLDEEKRIIVQPEYFFKSGFGYFNVKIFGDFAYVKGSGFSEIPAEGRLPKKYFNRYQISPGEELFFVKSELEHLRPLAVSIDNRLKRAEQLFLRFHRIESEKISKDWAIDLDYETEIGSVSAFEIWEGITQDKEYLFSEAGLLFLNDPRFSWLKEISKTRWDKGGIRLDFHPLDIIRLFNFGDIKAKIEGAFKSLEEPSQLFGYLEKIRKAEPLNLDNLHCSLRSYQESGVAWLWSLYNQGLSGILCDEMGLGKTHQAMALIASAFQVQRRKGKEGKYLIVCPTSVLYHWQNLLNTFLPNNHVYMFYGFQRKIEDFKSTCSILLTSYGMMRNAKDIIKKIKFDVAVFDELQYAKNIQSLTYKALKEIKADMFLGLTGTPIENRLSELRALFEIVLPSYLPKESVFKEFFVNPIEREGDQKKRSLLTSLIKPFILRRKKKDVLQELPEKIEEIFYTDLSDEQQELYQNIWNQDGKVVLDDLRNEKKPVEYMHIFALFSKLKQVCDHPCLIVDDVENHLNHQSGKWDLFVDLLQEARDSGQKVVVFSQYLTMLDIIEDYLKKENIGYAHIRGSTRDRGEQQQKFQKDPSCEVFVGSLQAAGVGIDLTAGSVVIHYDRWWNPARENQATDRVHRLGQSRGVQVFKMVSKNTIEEHIHNIIQKKTQLIENIVGYDDADQIKILDRNELIKLVQLIAF